MSYDKTGSNNPKWRGGHIHGPEGRLMIYMPGHPMAKCCGGIYILEYRLVMANKLGRMLKSNEVVHHINGNKHDNRPENLELMSRKDHINEHRAAMVKARRRQAALKRKKCQSD